MSTVRAKFWPPMNSKCETRASEQKYLGLGISSVPSLILNDKYLLQGAQPVESFEQALRQLVKRHLTILPSSGGQGHGIRPV